jgi:hypothetical protein
MTKDQVLTFAAAAQRDQRTVRIDVKRKPYHYIGTVAHVSRDTVQIDGAACLASGAMVTGRYFVRANGVTISDLTKTQESE